MKREYIIRIVAGTMVLTGISLAYFVSIKWLLLPAFVGVNLIQSSFTKFCPLEKLLDKLDVKQ
ncbi:hypothetical protein M2459_000039 [Parabacteroides sp. PF5-5]|uniref:YgaP family membrane protein n=1 Tax=unclassified Parabacteroides TaxID=2649774 RepID=UPI002474523C|nr:MULTISPECIES: DUF2892 domain-containing protein [unclassified Parabacteroides]MDH6303707.1 hypothetical protein [Parabacteroides sp. PH5-39]MDH6314324.1 hypothetical protein [Parabacteroides sp. PF5-13]MDH6318612.1 hypothetical protein [Parabacteroides sp. PH5-13]MDH6322096.1 hypothetical protein [Parabacteroides sp. PH5-8]MDH6325825.1 hypothetical protein [Parabacteroides sp. PH5-41]